MIFSHSSILFEYVCRIYIYIDDYIISLYGPGQRPATPFPHGIHPPHTSFHAGGLAIDHHPCAIVTCHAGLMPPIHYQMIHSCRVHSTLPIPYSPYNLFTIYYSPYSIFIVAMY